MDHDEDDAARREEERVLLELARELNGLLPGHLSTGLVLRLAIAAERKFVGWREKEGCATWQDLRSRFAEHLDPDLFALESPSYRLGIETLAKDGPSDVLDEIGKRVSARTRAAQARRKGLERRGLWHHEQDQLRYEEMIKAADTLAGDTWLTPRNAPRVERAIREAVERGEFPHDALGFTLQDGETPDLVVPIVQVLMEMRAKAEERRGPKGAFKQAALKLARAARGLEWRDVDAKVIRRKQSRKLVPRKRG